MNLDLAVLEKEMDRKEEDSEKSPKNGIFRFGGISFLSSQSKCDNNTLTSKPVIRQKSLCKSSIEKLNSSGYSRLHHGPSMAHMVGLRYVYDIKSLVSLVIQ